MAYMGDVLPPYTPLGSLWNATDEGVTPAAAEGVYVAGRCWSADPAAAAAAAPAGANGYCARWMVAVG